MISPPAIYAAAVVPAKPVDHDRILSAILAVEQNPWSRPGGGFGFTPAAWSEETTWDFSRSQNRRWATIVAHWRINRFVEACARAGLRPDAIHIADAWRRGFARAITRLRRGQPFSRDDYAQRVSNLCHDPDFP